MSSQKVTSFLHISTYFSQSSDPLIHFHVPFIIILIKFSPQFKTLKKKNSSVHIYINRLLNRDDMTNKGQNEQ